MCITLMLISIGFWVSLLSIVVVCFSGSSSIKVKDEATGAVRIVGAHDISSVSTCFIGRILTFFLLLTAILNC